MGLLEPLQGELECYCRRRLRDESHAEDVLQAAVTAAFSRFERFTEGTNFRAWMYCFITHELRNRSRKQSPSFWGEIPSEPEARPQDFQPPPGDLAADLIDRPDFLTDHLDEA